MSGVTFLLDENLASKSIVALTRGNLTAAQIVAAVLAAAPHIERIAKSRRGVRSVLARITSLGKVNIGDTRP